MAVFMVERRFADQLEVDPAAAASINRINDGVGVRWLKSFLSSDKRKTFCLYEADDVEAIRTAAIRAGIPADAIMELSGTLSPDGSFAPM
jgi:Nickel responsive protein SCO4226-like